MAFCYSSKVPYSPKSCILTSLLSIEDQGRVWTSAGTVIRSNKLSVPDALAAIETLEQEGWVAPAFENFPASTALRLTPAGRLQALQVEELRQCLKAGLEGKSEPEC